MAFRVRSSASRCRPPSARSASSTPASWSPRRRASAASTRPPSAAAAGAPTPSRGLHPLLRGLRGPRGPPRRRGAGARRYARARHRTSTALGGEGDCRPRGARSAAMSSLPYDTGRQLVVLRPLPAAGPRRDTPARGRERPPRPYRHDHGPRHHRPRLLRLRRRGPALARPVPGLRRVEHARGGAARRAGAGRAAGRGGARPAGRSSPCALRRRRGAARHARLQTGIGELDRVLGGGLVPGSLVLIGGSPGIGKSTLTSMALGNLAGRRPRARSTSPARSRRRRSGCAPSGCPARRCRCPCSPRPTSRPCSRRSTPSGRRSA